MKTLYNYQVDGIQTLQDRKRCILADDMGLGKSAEAIVAVRGPRCKVLIVCPKSVLRVWEDQIREWAPKATISRLKWTCDKAIVEGSTSNFVLINYENIIARGGDNWKAEWLASRNWTAIIFDEAHRLKNRKSKTFQAAKKVCKKQKNISLIPITATPVLNSPEELWPLLHIIDPEQFSSFWRWVRTYFRTRPSYFNARAIEIEEVLNPGKLRRDIEPFLIRRTKEDVWKDMPEKTYQTIYVDMENEQRKHYDTMLNEMHVQLLEGKLIDAINIVSQMTRLKQITVSHHLLDKESDRLEGAKISALNDIVEGAGEQKVVVFSQYAQAINRLELGGCVKFTGETPVNKRDFAIHNFQNNPDIKVLATTIQCGGVGITLTAGTIAVFLDLLWTPALNSQAVDRLHRLGQKRPVTAITLIARETIEDYILSVLKEKEDIFNSTIPETSLSNHLLDYLKETVH